MQKNLCCFINARSGNGDGARLLAALQGECAVISVDFNNLSSQLKTARNFERIAVAGGDGTLSALITHDDLPTCPVAVIPLGTANDLARELGGDLTIASQDPSVITQSILSSPTTFLRTWQLTVGETSVRFCNYCSFGFEGHVLRDFSRWRSESRVQNRFLNRAMYLWFAIKHSGYTTPPMRLGEIKLPLGSSLLFANVRSYMGLGISNNQGSFADAAIECITIPSVFTYLRMMIGKQVRGVSPNATSHAGPLCISGIDGGVPMQVDGEYVGECLGEIATITPLRVIEVCGGAGG